MQSGHSSLVYLQYLTTVFDNVQDVVLLIAVEPGQTYRLLMANDAYFRETGYDRTTIGEALQDIVNKKSYAHLTAQYNAVIETKEALFFTHWYTVPNGEQAFSVKLIPILNALGEVVQIASISRNVTELEELRQKVTETTKALDTLTMQLRTA